MEGEFVHAVDLLSYDAVRKKGQFAIFNQTNNIPSSQTIGGVTYVLANTVGQGQFNAPANVLQPSAGNQGNTNFQYSQDVVQQQTTQMGTSNVTNASMPPPNAAVTKYHSSPNKVTGSPRIYQIMGSSGGYYQQCGQ